MTLRRGPVKIALVILVILLVLWLWMRPKPVMVMVKPVEKGTVEQTVNNTRAGTVMACHRAKLAPATGGLIAKLPIRKGDRVKKGDVLLELWNEDTAASVILAQQEVVAAQARADEACVVKRMSQKEASRMLKLREDNITSEETTDRAVGESKAKNAACNASRALMNVKQAQLQMAKAVFEKTKLLAPFDGVVAELNGELGEFITPSPVGVMTLPAVDLVDTQCMYIKAPLDEVDAPKVQLGMEARISLDAFPKQQFAGKVRGIASYVLDLEKQARVVDVEVEFNPIPSEVVLLAGYSADAEISIHKKTGILRIPTEAIRESNLVYVLNRKSRIEKREIRTGLGNWSFTEVIGGLQDGEMVIISPNRPGVEVGAYAVAELQ